MKIFNRSLIFIPRLLMMLLLMMGSLDAMAVLNMSYVELNSNKLSNIGCFVNKKNHKPFFNMTAIFAANINGEDVNHPYVYFNSEIDELLNHSDTVNELHQKGIKVLLTILGNHQQAGWSCMTDSKQAKVFANTLAMIVDKYHLDGIDIDDEYSPCSTNDYSMIMISHYLKTNPLFKDKLLTKALFRDAYYFRSEYEGVRLADLLDFGWEMSYGGGAPSYRLAPYVNYGMQPQRLLFGESTGDYQPQAASWAKETIDDGYRGIMVYNVTRDSASFLDAIAKAEGQEGVDILPHCLK